MIDKISETLVKPTNTEPLVKPEKIEQPIEEIQKELTSEELDITKSVVKLLNELPGNELEFGFNDEARMSTISVFERDSHRLIREFPSKEFFSRLSYFKTLFKTPWKHKQFLHKSRRI